ncbi:MAG TPA: prepilin-type N-terminal cleavage/methylation domain-containing protein [Candidatus Ozemobacteraceae bacterium]|nr:prepilin-type N-terminal cleavage/methylation domain-containing protein [Candidatus Ozemobacteraceae bacterium]
MTIRSRSGRAGFSLLEVLIGMGLFLVILASLVRLFTEVTMPQQGMIRDYAMVMGLSERFVNGLIEDIMKGDPPPETPGGTELDVTESVIEVAGHDPTFAKIFTGGAGKEATELTVNFKALLTVQDLGKTLGSDIGSPDGRYFQLHFRCTWGPQRQHSYALTTAAMRR